MDRKLATIQIIKNVEPVVTRDGEVAHSVELVTFEDIGWQCVAKKGEFKPGDWAVYIEISTVVPEHPVFEFLRPKGFKVKTQKFVGTTLSQGLALPFATLDEFGLTIALPGDDVSEHIGVRRFDPELDVKFGGDCLGVFPTHILPKTDQERLQSVPWVIQRANDFDMVATLKYDGTSSTFFWGDDNVLHACSRNFEQKPGNGSVYWTIAEKYGFAKILERFPWLVIQGEIIGPKIQKNRLGLQGLEFRCFGLWHRNTNAYMSFEQLETFCLFEKIPCVEALVWWKQGTFGQETVESLLEKAAGFYNGTKNHREGLVIRPLRESVFDYRLGGAFSFKVINNDYLLGGGE